VSFGPNFEYGDIPKNPNMLLKHIFGGANAFPALLSDFQQPGGTQNHNSDHTRDLEGHGVPLGSKVLSGSIFEYVDIPKWLIMRLEHKFAWANAFHGPRTIFCNLEALKIKTREMRVFVRVTAHQGPQK
jgi:hypothetical protein